MIIFQKKLTIKLFFLLMSTTLLISFASAEITSKECPYDCDTQGLNRSTCKDWRADAKCFIDDGQPAKQVDAAKFERKIVMVNKTVLAGKSIDVTLPDNNPLDHLDAVVKREGGNTDTSLSASLGGNAIKLGTHQVDQTTGHVIRFAANGTRAEGRKLVLSALNGDVFVESVHVLNKEAAQ